MICGHHMVTVPSHWPCYMQQDLRDEEQSGRDFVAHLLCRVEVATVQADQYLVGHSVSQIKL